MSQTVITKAFVEWKAKQAIDNQPVVLDEFIFAYIPGLDVNKPIANTEGLPAADKIVHRQAVGKAGVVNLNAVVYSVTMGAEVGDFDFNWIGLVNKASGTLASIIHAPTQRKVKNANGQQGNVLTRSVLMEFNGAQTETRINVPAETWQIDFTARLAGMDEAARLANLDIYGAGAFFESGFLVAKTGNQYFVTQGLGYIGGLRAALANNQNITLSAKPTKVWADVCYHGTVTSTYRTEIKITVAGNLANYTENGIAHYVFALASIDAAGVITDLRPKGSRGEQQANSDFLRKDDNLAALKDKAKSRGSLGLGTAATRNVGTGSGNVMEMGTAGLGVGPIAKTDAYSNIAQFYRVNASAANKPPAVSGNVSAGVVCLPMDAAPSSGYVAVVGGNMAAYVGISQAEANGITWARIYTDKFKPTAADINAVAKTGDRMSGPLGTTYADSYRIVSGKYGSFWRNDGNATYFMLTNADDQWGAYNSLRPFGVNNATGAVTLGTQITFEHAEYVRKLGINTYQSNGVTYNQTNGFHLQGSGDNYAQIYFLETVGQYTALRFRVRGGGEDGWPEFRSNGSVYLGGRWPAIINSAGTTWHPDGNVEGPQWGGYLSNWLNNQFTARDNNINTRATWDYVNSRSAVAGGRGGWWYKDEVTGLIFQGGTVTRGGDVTWVGFPRGYQRECFGVQMTLFHRWGTSQANVEARDAQNGGFNAVMFEQEHQCYWWAVGV
ncbi:MAG: phage tail protein [Enterobacterales bacterium endosymbiont of Blomia tropicalis]|uniref:phage tail-collar fiber domain-containing protein n=1 Tax=Mixta mediterraneensis TaxID=2758443 RepID=UPI0025A724C0|nr:phage tail protein [Mixta mediterraneensis]MDL4913070.1 phage tail protein [Mixta mediterraneensis]